MKDRERTSPKPPTVAWLLCLLAIPMLYLCSVPPVYRFTGTLHKLSAGGPPFQIFMVPRWVSSYCLPYFWLWSQTPLRQPLHAYLKVWGVTHVGNKPLKP